MYMKKIFLILALISGICVSAQNTEKILKANKWYASAAAGEKTIILSKTAPESPAWNATFDDKGSMNFCSHLTSAILVNGKEIKVGEYYCDPSYTYTVNGNVLTILYPLVDWPYYVKPLPNGDLILSSTR
jgi:hypothetical protein